MAALVGSAVRAVERRESAGPAARASGAGAAAPVWWAGAEVRGVLYEVAPVGCAAREGSGEPG
ncbi:hypothetical protein, partial [Nocardia brasiliensis]|uniref:hypothetical protein n=1 Tax=Nocardia brasiliensis TaxID=37326 RepID=UPI0024580C0E